MRWTAEDIAVDLVTPDTDHPVGTFTVETPSGRLRMMAEISGFGPRLHVRKAHIQADRGMGPNSLGPSRLRHLVFLVMEVLDVRELVVEGEARTTGAHPGHRPRPLRFTRALPP